MMVVHVFGEVTREGGRGENSREKWRLQVRFQHEENKGKINQLLKYKHLKNPKLGELRIQLNQVQNIIK